MLSIRLPKRVGVPDALKDLKKPDHPVQQQRLGWVFSTSVSPHPMTRSPSAKP